MLPPSCIHTSEIFDLFDSAINPETLLIPEILPV